MPSLAKTSQTPVAAIGNLVDTLLALRAPNASLHSAIARSSEHRAALAELACIALLSRASTKSLDALERADCIEKATGLAQRFELGANQAESSLPNLFRACVRAEKTHYSRSARPTLDHLERLNRWAANSPASASQSAAFSREDAQGFLYPSLAAIAKTTAKALAHSKKIKSQSSNDFEAFALRAHTEAAADCLAAAASAQGRWNAHPAAAAMKALAPIMDRSDFDWRQYIEWTGLDIPPALAIAMGFRLAVSDMLDVLKHAKSRGALRPESWPKPWSGGHPLRELCISPHVDPAQMGPAIELLSSEGYGADWSLPKGFSGSPRMPASQTEPNFLLQWTKSQTTCYRAATQAAVIAGIDFDERNKRGETAIGALNRRARIMPHSEDAQLALALASQYGNPSELSSRKTALAAASCPEISAIVSAEAERRELSEGIDAALWIECLAQAQEEAASARSAKKSASSKGGRL